MKSPTFREWVTILISIIAIFISIYACIQNKHVMEVDSNESSTIISQEEYIQKLENFVTYQQNIVQEYRVQNRDSLFVIISNKNMIQTYNNLANGYEGIMEMIDSTVVFTPIQKGQIELQKRASRMRGQYELIEELVKKQ